MYRLKYLFGLILAIYVGYLAFTKTGHEKFCKGFSSASVAVGGAEFNCIDPDSIPPENMKQITPTLSDQINLSYVPAEIGGTYKVGDTTAWKYQDEADALIAQMKTVNALDPVVNVYGLFENGTHKPIIMFDKAIKALQNVSEVETASSRGLELTTQHGRVYEVTPQMFHENTRASDERHITDEINVR